MPKSKRERVIPLTQTDKKGRQGKLQLFQNIRDSLDSFKNAYVLHVDCHMRNLFLKEMREQWSSHSSTSADDTVDTSEFVGRFFWGRNRVMAKSLGETAEEAYHPGLDGLSSHLKGNVGLLLTNCPAEKVLEYFQQFQRIDYARAGSVAAETVTLSNSGDGEGPLMLTAEEPFPASMEQQLRQLGVPSRLKTGKVHLSTKEYVVCKKGDTLSNEQARVLKMFYKQLAVFKVDVVAHWSGETGDVVQLMDISDKDVASAGDDMIEMEEELIGEGMVEL